MVVYSQEVDRHWPSNTYLGIFETSLPSGPRSQEFRIRIGIERRKSAGKELEAQKNEYAAIRKLPFQNQPERLEQEHKRQRIVRCRLSMYKLIIWPNICIQRRQLDDRLIAKDIEFQVLLKQHRKSLEIELFEQQPKQQEQLKKGEKGRARKKGEKRKKKSVE